MAGRPLRPPRIELAPGLEIPRVLTGLWQVADMERDGTPLDPDAAGRALAEYAAGRMTAQQLVGVVANAYWSQELGARSREVLRPIIDVIERAHPGVVELTGSLEKPGFVVKLADRPFPKQYDADLRMAVQAIATAPSSSSPTPDSQLLTPGFVTRLFRAIRRLFSA